MRICLCGLILLSILLSFILIELELTLESALFGQHLAERSANSLIPRHFRSPPRHALVMSLHGWTGTGKNHMSRIIAKSLYVNGMNSQYVHYLSGPKDFPRPELKADYQVRYRL